MKYEVIRDCMIKGEQCKVGKVVELDDVLSKALMAIGRVAPASEKPVVENRSVGLEDSSEKPKRRTRAKKAKDVRDSE